MIIPQKTQNTINHKNTMDHKGTIINNVFGIIYLGHFHRVGASFLLGVPGYVGKCTIYDDS